jgi:hypothetical protein
LSDVNPRGAGGSQPAAGAYSLSEILSQPQCWADCLKELEAGSGIGEIAKRFRKYSEWLFIGRGVIDEMVKPYPGHFLVFTQIDWSKIDDPNFSQEMIAQQDFACYTAQAVLKRAMGSKGRIT